MEHENLTLSISLGFVIHLRFAHEIELIHSKDVVIVRTSERNVVFTIFHKM